MGASPITLCEIRDDGVSQVKNNGADRVPVSRSFHRRLMSFNNLGSRGFEEWIFQPAMLFGSTYKWWGDLGKRERPHEGLDICLYRTKEGNIYYLTGETEIPVMLAGRVVKVTTDFLGESVFVSHSVNDSKKRQLYTIYGHITPGNHICPGERLREGDSIGVMADTVRSGFVIPPHLHVSVAWIPNAMPVHELGWETMHGSAGVVLLDPLSVIGCPYSIVPATLPVWKA